jgi:hypothetical protein
MLFLFLATTLLATVLAGLGEQHFFHDAGYQREVPANTRSILQSDEFRLKINKTLAEWRVPGISVSIVRGDEIYSEVSDLPFWDYSSLQP